MRLLVHGVEELAPLSVRYEDVGGFYRILYGEYEPPETRFLDLAVEHPGNVGVHQVLVLDVDVALGIRDDLEVGIPQAPVPVLAVRAVVRADDLRVRVGRRHFLRSRLAGAHLPGQALGERSLNPDGERHCLRALARLKFPHVTVVAGSA